ncbi:MAG: AAA family ATPase [Lachnospiraceae bacterium]|nr:AAA family ATPase [Lachnospiraceae bacterium]
MAGYRSYDNDLAQNKITLKDINIIIGANGAGKSNLISFLEMVSYMMTRGLRRYVARQGGAQSLLYFGAGQTEQISGELQIHDANGRKEDMYSFSLERSATDQLYFAREQIRYQDEGHSKPYEKDFGIGHQETELSGAWDNTVRTLRNYLERLRVFHFNDTTINAKIRSTANEGDGSYLRSDGGNIAAFLYQMREDPADQPYYKRIIRYIRMALPQFFDFVLEPDGNGNLSLNWRQEGAEEMFGPHQFSDGALRFVALTTLLLQPVRTAPMTIILDEPEIGLHPYAVSMLAKEIRMASRTSQIIVSTQSPLLLNEFSCEDVITAEYDQVNQRSVLRRHKEEDLREWLEDYTLGELWEKNVLGGLPL